jgi:type II secretory pathway component PulJ
VDPEEALVRHVVADGVGSARLETRRSAGFTLIELLVVIAIIDRS